MKEARHSRRSGRTHAKGGYLTTMQSHIVAAVGELVGTFFFLYMAYGGQIMVLSQYGFLAAGGGTSSETVVFISLIYSMSLLVNAWLFYRISGGLFNPAVSVFLFFDLLDQRLHHSDQSTGEYAMGGYIQG